MIYPDRIKRNDDGNGSSVASAPDRFTLAVVVAPEHSQTPEFFLGMRNQEILDYLFEHFPEITAEVWQQLNILNELAIELQIRLQQPETPPEVKKEVLAKTHLNYELGMIRIVLAFQAEITEYFFAEDASPIRFGDFEITREDFIHALVDMILLSDIGKAGGKALAPGESSPILEIYTHVILDVQRHGEWLKKQKIEDLPPNLGDAIQNIQSNPSRARQVFEAGNYGEAPIHLALFCAEQVFAASFPEEAERFAALFQIDETTQEALAQIGMNPDTTPMKDFWTRAHIYCAEQLFQTSAIPEELRGIALLALFHHYSQGVGPDQAGEIDLADPRAIKLIALSEILDKADANCHRSQSSSIDHLIRLTENMVVPGILRQNNQDPTHPEVVAYAEMLNFLKEQGILSSLLNMCVS